jgi:hypothetical protein
VSAPLGRTPAAFVREHGDTAEPFLVLTDEEFYVVTAGVPAAERVVPLEVLDALDSAEVDARARGASRSLAARGLLAGIDGAETDQTLGLVELEVRGRLSLVLHALSFEGVIVLASGTHQGDQRRRAIIPFADAGVIEHAFGGGVHEFRIWSAVRACIELASLIDPAGLAGSEDVDLARAPADADEARPPWLVEDPTSTAHVRRASSEGPPLELLFSADPEHRLVVVSGEAAGTDGELSHLRARSVSKGTLLGLCAHVLDLGAAIRPR